VTKPTAREVFEAIGYSLGNLRVRVEGLIFRVKPWVKRFILLTIAGIGIYSLVTMRTVLQVSAAGAWVLFALGVFLLGAAAFCYVLFSFLMALMKTSPAVAADIEHMVQKAAHPLRTVAPQPSSEGSFVPYDDNRGYMQEQFEELKKAGILNDTDTLDKVIAEDEDFDFETIKAKARGD
jgi:hypothetical protein